MGDNQLPFYHVLAKIEITKWLCYSGTIIIELDYFHGGVKIVELKYIMLGKRIKEVRRKCRLSQAELAEMIDKSPTYVSYLESGIKCPSLETLVEIANAMRTTADYLLAESLNSPLAVDSSEYTEVFIDCNPYERRVIIESAKALKKAMREYGFLSKRQKN